MHTTNTKSKVCQGNKIVLVNSTIRRNRNLALDSNLIQLIPVVHKMKNIWEQDQKKKNGKKNTNNEKYKLMYFVSYILFVFILMVILKITTYPYLKKKIAELIQ